MSPLRLGRIAGTDIEARPSLLIAAAVLVLLIAPRYAPTDAPAYAIAAVLVGALYLSILLHELAHLAAAKAYRMPVRAVTLHLMGGETAIEGGSRRPGQEIVTAAVGPLVSAVLALLAVSASRVVGSIPGDVLWLLGWLNLLLALFNLVPALPLDGGRVLRGAVWALTGSQSRGLVVTAWSGRGCAVLLIGGVVALNGGGDGSRLVLDVLIAGVLAVFLWLGAESALRQARWQRRVGELSARALARPLPEGAVPDWPGLDVDARGETLVRALAQDPAERYLLLAPDGTPVGVLERSDVDEAYRRQP